MKKSVVIGIILLFAVWVILCVFMLRAGGLNLKNIFVVIASGIVIFVPLWKKYISANERKE